MDGRSWPNALTQQPYQFSQTLCHQSWKLIGRFLTQDLPHPLNQPMSTIMKWVWPFLKSELLIIELQVSSYYYYIWSCDHDVIYISLSDPNQFITSSTHGCIGPTPSPDSPVPDVVVCSTGATPTNLTAHTFLHGDM